VDIPGAQPLNGTVDHGGNGSKVRIANAQQQDVLPAGSCGRRARMRDPGIGTFAVHPLDQLGKSHDSPACFYSTRMSIFPAT
jgi:hypothetical protein